VGRKDKETDGVDVMKEMGIGILGFGTVGAGVVEGLRRNRELLADRTGIRPVVRRIADLDLTADRGVAVDRSLLTTDAAAVVADPEVDVVVELIGGTGAARTFILQALAAGKPVVTANKALLAEHGRELFEAARAAGTGLYFEASVGGGIPVMRALKDGLIGNRIESICGILNGTCNYILTRMEREGAPFDEVLKEAQALGYAETPPDLDIDGMDTAHKAVVLASLAYGTPVPMSACSVQGIRGLDLREIEYARELGYCIKLLALIKNHEHGYELRVQPTLVPQDHMLASVHEAFNAIFVEGDIVGETLYYGRGAGRFPTASAVIGDIMEAALKRQAGGTDPLAAWILGRSDPQMMPPEENRLRCYLRMGLKDESDVLARVAHVLGSHNISIASVVQKERRCGAYIPVVFLTHRARECEFAAALAELDGLDCVEPGVVRLAVEDFSGDLA